MKKEFRQSLRKLLADFYPDEASIRRIIADSGMDAASIVLNSSAINNWQAVLTEAEKLGRINALLDVVECEYGANIYCARAQIVNLDIGRSSPPA
jgi:hypothetical protein